MGLFCRQVIGETCTPARSSETEAATDQRECKSVSERGGQVITILGTKHGELIGDDDGDDDDGDDDDDQTATGSARAVRQGACSTYIRIRKHSCRCRCRCRRRRRCISRRMCEKDCLVFLSLFTVACLVAHPPTQ